MKNLAILIFALGFCSCKKEKDNVSVFPDDYSFTATKNNDKWIGSSSIQSSSTNADTVSFFFVSNHPNDEVLVLRVKFNGSGIYPLNPNQAFYYSTIGGDVITSRYFMGSSDTGKLVITNYDATKETVDGTFEISVKKQSANPPNDIDVLKFANGTFKAKFPK